MRCFINSARASFRQARGKERAIDGKQALMPSPRIASRSAETKDDARAQMHAVLGVGGQVGKPRAEPVSLKGAHG